MTEPPDYEQLAKRYLDLWQDQLAAAAGDPKLAREMARLASLMKQSPFGWMADQFGADAGAEPNRSADDRSEATGGPASAGTSPAGSADDLDDLARRVAELEARVAALEGTARTARKPRTRE
jgi:hypothetical protein